MTDPRFSFVPVTGHEIHVTEWGDPDMPALIMWHGLARTGRDFDELAAALSDTYFVICPDTIGRGLSSWSQNPEAEYSIAYYADIAAGLLDHYRVAQAAWLGTSMGGQVGMRLASGPAADRISRLIINDIGPEVPQAAIDRILSYANTSPQFDTLSDAEAWFRTIYAPFGPAGDAFWKRMTRSSVRRRAGGRFTTHFDPRITVQFTASPEELTSWDRFQRIGAPVHVIRGEHSDILTAPIAERMAERAGTEMTVIPGCGHAASLSRPEDFALIRGILGAR